MTNKQKYINISVGFFMLFGAIALFFMIVKVSGVSDFSSRHVYHVTADFTDIGALKVHAPVTIAGVRIGEVDQIELKSNDLNAKVTLKLDTKRPIPFDDVSARILTEGLLGASYISIVPGFGGDKDPSHLYLREGDVIAKTQEAVILENLIGQLLFNVNQK